MEVDLDEEEVEYKIGNVVKVNLGDNRKIVGEIMQIRFDEDKKYLLHYHCEESGVRINEWIRGADIANCGPFDDEDFLIWMTGDTVRTHDRVFGRLIGKIWGIDQGVYKIHGSNRLYGTKCGIVYLPVSTLMRFIMGYRCHIEPVLFQPGNVVEFGKNERISGEIMSKRENNVCMVHWHNEQHNYDSWETAVHIDELGIAHIDNVCAFKPSVEVRFQYGRDVLTGRIWYSYQNEPDGLSYQIHCRQKDGCRFFPKIPMSKVLME